MAQQGSTDDEIRDAGDGGAGLVTGLLLVVLIAVGLFMVFGTGGTAPPVIDVARPHAVAGAAPAGQ